MKHAFKFLFCALLFNPLSLRADGRAPEIRTEILAEARQIRPGDTFLVGVQFLIEEGWHIYWKVSGDAGFPTDIEWTVPKGVTISDLKWPRPHIFDEEGEIRTAGYKDAVILLASVKVSPDWPAGKPIDLKANAKWLVCKVLCIPGGAKIAKRIATGQKQIVDKKEVDLLAASLRQVPPPEEEERILAELRQKIPAAKLTFLTALLFAFLGGLVLNVMPCVLPVLAIKVFRLTKHKERERGDLVRESLAYMGGVLFSFAILGGLVVFIKSIGQEIGWGFQFQEPRFLVALTAILFLSALSFMGYFEFTFFVPASLTHHLQKGGTAGAVWDGFLATLLATPCTAPLLGPALGFSFSQPPLIIFLFFIVIGVGLAAPYVMFALAPQMTVFLPKPGAWMETFKELMGFPLLGTGIWLLWILGQQKGVDAVVGLLIFLLALVLALWGARHSTKALPRLIFAAVVVFTYLKVVEPSLRSGAAEPAVSGANSRWKPFSSYALEELLNQKKTVLVDFTADWCLTCQLNKRVLHSKAVERALDEENVVTLLADWTSRSEEITRALRQLGRSGVPAYALYRKGNSTPVLLPELLTESAVVEALQKTR